MTIAGLDYTLRNHTFVHEQKDWTGDPGELEALIVERFRQIIDALPRHLLAHVSKS